MEFDLRRAVALLQTFAGRDKTVRSAYYALVFVIGRLQTQSPLAARLQALAKQLSSFRFIGRRMNDLSMLLADRNHWRQLRDGTVKDVVTWSLQAVINVVNTFYHPIEHVAWLADHKMIGTDPTPWFRMCLYIWITSLVCTMIISLRQYIRSVAKRLELTNSDETLVDFVGFFTGTGINVVAKELMASEREQLWTLTMSLADFMNAINGLPKGFLWSGTLPQWKIGAYGFIASVMSLLRLYRSTRVAV